jgi:hypothetical protein
VTLLPPVPDHLSPPVMRAIANALHEITEKNMLDILDQPDPASPVTFFPLGDPKPASKWRVLGRFVVEKLAQPSTIRGLLMLGTSLGLVLSPAAQEYILEIGMAVVGLVGVAADK